MEAKVNIKQTVVNTIEDITLSLSVKDAVALAIILNRVGGSPYDSLRGNSQSMLSSLKDVGVDPINFKLVDHAVNGYISFENSGEQIEDIIKQTEEDIINANQYKVITNTNLEYLLNNFCGNNDYKIKAIKEFRTICDEAGLNTGLRDAKEEIERRLSNLTTK
jgi:hypothetical protein